MKSSVYRYIALFIVAILFQASIVRYLEIFSWKPDLVLIILIMFSIQSGPSLGSTAGFFAGLLTDLISGHFLGLGALSKTIAGFISGIWAKYFPEKTQFIITLAIGGFLHNIIYFFLLTIGIEFSWRSLVFVYTVPNLFYTTLVGLFINFLIRSWLKED